MKFLFLFSINLWFGIVSFEQKRFVDYSTPDSWPLLAKETISDDGKYLSYMRSSPASGPVLVIRSTDRDWERAFPSGGAAVFTADNRFLIFRQGSDSLGILDIARDSVIYREHMSSFKVCGDASASWLAYRPGSGIKDLVLLMLVSGRETRFSKVSNYAFAPGRALLALEAEDDHDSTDPTSLSLVDLSKGLRSTIWTGKHPCQFVFSPLGKELALKTDTIDGRGKTYVVIEYYKTGMNKSVLLVGPSTPGMEGRVLTEGSVIDLSFSRDGKNLFFYTRPAINDQANTMPQQVHIWNSKDIVLDDQFYSASSPRSKQAAVSNLFTTGSRVIALERDIADFFDHKPKCYDNDRVLVYSSYIGMMSEYKWRPSARMGIFLVSTRDGSKKLIAKNLIYTYAGFSASGKYVIYYNRELKNWFAYETADNSIRDISLKVKRNLSIDMDYPDPQSAPAEGIVGWLDNDTAVLVYDRFDIWQLDPLGRKLPVNLTKGYGRKHHIRLRAPDFNGNYDFPLRWKDTLLLTAFNVRTKYSGFCKLLIGNRETLIKFPMYPKTVYYVPRFSADYSDASTLFVPLKAKNAEIYLCKTMTVSKYPNIYVTHDFEHFAPLTTLEPQKNVSWFTDELVHWRLPDGRNGEGILYKPEDFDEHRKYPVIFYIYDKFSDDLHTFLNPTLSNGLLNIPWYLSRDYLVFVPDIYFQVGHPGESAFRTVESAAKYLSHYAWVNSRAIGIQGHSFGAWEVNYIVARTKMFSAVASVDGMTDLISDAGKSDLSTSNHLYYEEGQGRIGASLWENPSYYIENSPVFHANRVSTPILIAHNKGDNVVYFSQAMEWFTALRRLGKPAWLLQYNEPDNHTLSDPADQLDYSIRLSQFFGHFLKGAPAPEWMSSKLVSERKNR
jgi:dipeptidyl aminopeptidase/acylaminoacyl peptidase